MATVFVTGTIFLLCGRSVDAALNKNSSSYELYDELDWLVESPSRYEPPSFSGPLPCGPQLLGGAPETNCYTISNGLVTRTFAALEDGGFGTIAFVGEGSLFRGPTPQHALRAIADEANLRLDGIPYRVGSLQPVLGTNSSDSSGLHGLYLNRSGLSVETVPGSWVLVNVSSSGSELWPQGMVWSPRRSSSNISGYSWPPEGIHVALTFQAPSSTSSTSPSPPDAAALLEAHESVVVTVHYELYRGTPLLSKWVEVSLGNVSSGTQSSSKTPVVGKEASRDAHGGAPAAGSEAVVVVSEVAVELLALNSEFAAPGGGSFGGGSWAPSERAALLDVTADTPHGAQVLTVRSPSWEENTDAGAAEPLVVANYTLGPAARISASSAPFRSFRVHELLHEGVDLERQSLARRRVPRLLAPWTTESPLFLHLTDASAAGIEAAAEQCQSVGFDMIILSFGTSFDMEVSSVPEDLKEAIAYANSLGVEIGGYDLIDLQRGFGGYGAYVGDEYTAVAVEVDEGGEEEKGNGRLPAKAGAEAGASSAWAGGRDRRRGGPAHPDSTKEGSTNVTEVKLEDACFASGWVEELRAYLELWADQGGLTAFELDGPYGGGSCASLNHSHHSGLEDSVFAQSRETEELLTWLTSERPQGKAAFVNQPDEYFFYGGAKTGMGYNEDQYSLPRWEDLSVSRAGMFDDTFRYTPTMGWMQVPLVDYHGGGEDAAFELLSDHPEAFEMALAQYLGFGVAACWRGPRLYDTPDTEALVNKWTSFYRQYRQVLTSDVVHIRRADGQSWDAILHVAPASTVTVGDGDDDDAGGVVKGILLVFNPTDYELGSDGNDDNDSGLNSKIKVPLYYTGITDTAKIIEGPGKGVDGSQWVRRHSGAKRGVAAEASSTVLPLNRRYEVTLSVTMEPRSARWYLLVDADGDAV